MTTENLESIPVTLDLVEIAAGLGLDPARKAFAGLEELVTLAQGLIHPRGCYHVAFVEARGERSVELSGIVFHSRILSGNLGGVDKVFPYIVTVGPDLERTAAAQGDLVKQYYLEEIANIALEQAAVWLAGYLESRYGVTGLAGISPGSLEDWPITEQDKLFSIFGDPERLVGVRLTESMLMVPRKSISGIFFPSEEGFVACQLCGRERCSARKAPKLISSS